MNKTELESNITKIKKFLKQRDYNAIDTGIELAHALDEPLVFETLLGGWFITEDGKFAIEEGYKGKTLAKKWSDETLPYYTYALINLIGHAPENTKLHESLEYSKIKNLNLSGFSWSKLPSGLKNIINLTNLDLSGCHNLQNVDGLAKCINLTSLNLGNCSSLQNINGLLNCIKLDGSIIRGENFALNLSHCTSLQNLDGLSNCINLTALSLNECKSIENLDGLANLTSLSHLWLDYCNSLQNVDGLANLPNLTLVSMRIWIGTPSRTIRPSRGNSKLETHEDVADYQGKIRIAKALLNADEDDLLAYKDVNELDLSNSGFTSLPGGLTKLTKLTSLNLGSCNSLQNVDGLSNCTKLTSLNLGSCDSLQNVDSLSSCAKLTNLELYGCDSLQNVDGLIKLTNLTSLNLNSCKSIQNIDGLANCTKLTEIYLISCSSLQNINGLSNCTKFNSLDLSKCNSLQNVDGLSNCTKLTSLNLGSCDSLQNVDSLSSCAKLTNLELYGCDSLQNVDGLTKLIKLTNLSLSVCNSLQNVDGLVNCTKLTSLDLSKCNSLQNVDGLTNLTNLIKLNLSKCKALKPKPSPVYMTTSEQVATYLKQKLLTDSVKTISNQHKTKYAKNIRTTLAKLKKFLKKRDYDLVNQGVELSISLSEPAIFEALLEGCSINDKGELIRNKIFSGTAPAQPYLDYAILRLAQYTPTDAKIDTTLHYGNNPFMERLLVFTRYANLTPKKIYDLGDEKYARIVYHLDLESADANWKIKNIAYSICATLGDRQWTKDLIELVAHNYTHYDQIAPTPYPPITISNSPEKRTLSVPSNSEAGSISKVLFGLSQYVLRPDTLDDEIFSNKLFDLSIDHAGRRFGSTKIDGKWVRDRDLSINSDDEIKEILIIANELANSDPKKAKDLYSIVTKKQQVE